MYVLASFPGRPIWLIRPVTIGLIVLFGLFSPKLASTSSPYMPAPSDCFPTGESPYLATGSYLFTKHGIGAAVADINDDRREDIILLSYSLSLGSISGNFVYTIGWNIDPSTGSAATWSPLISVSGFSHVALHDVGVAVYDLNGNSRPDMVVMGFADVPGGVKFVYRIAWDLDVSGRPASVSDKYEIDGVGPAEVWDGAGIALRDINQNGTIDLLVMAYGGSERGYNSFRYRIGWDLDSNGNPASWQPGYATISGLGTRATGADVVVEDIDLDGTDDLVLMAYDRTDGRSLFRYKVGWEVNAAGHPSRWSRWFQLKGVGPDISGVGLAYYYHRISGPRLVMAAHHRPEGARNVFRYVFLPVTTSGAYFGSADDDPPRINNQLAVPTGGSTLTASRLFNLNMRDVRTAANDAVSIFLFGCWLDQVSGATPRDECRYNYPNESPQYGSFIADERFDYEMAPDALVASVAFYVDYYMGYAKDEINSYVLNSYHNLNYYFGAEKTPAYYTIHYTDPARHPDLIDDLDDVNAEWALVYNDGKRFHGDCEDHAILRHALLRSLGFDRSLIWNANAPRHEFNVVAYRGVLRIMDYGPIHRYLDSPSGITTGISSAWNEDSGPNQNSTVRDANFTRHILKKIYPDRCNGGAGWAFTRPANPDIR